MVWPVNNHGCNLFVKCLPLQKIDFLATIICFLFLRVDVEKLGEKKFEN